MSCDLMGEIFISLIFNFYFYDIEVYKTLIYVLFWNSYQLVSSYLSILNNLSMSEDVMLPIQVYICIYFLKKQG